MRNPISFSATYGEGVNGYDAYGSMDVFQHNDAKRLCQRIARKGANATAEEREALQMIASMLSYTAADIQGDIKQSAESTYAVLFEATEKKD